MKYSANFFLTITCCCICGFLLQSTRPLHAQEASLEEVLKCDEINDAVERLKCFDTVVDLLKSSPPNPVSANDKAPASSQSGTNATPPVPPPPPPTAEELFGDPPPPKLAKGETPPPNTPKEIKEIISGLKNYWINNDRDYVIVLDNGQIWQTLDGSTLRFPSNPSEVRVRKNFLGSYIMEIRNEKRGGRTGKVKRIR